MKQTANKYFQEEHLLGEDWLSIALHKLETASMSDEEHLNSLISVKINLSH